jgi:hypothetical protein
MNAEGLAIVQIGGSARSGLDQKRSHSVMPIPHGDTCRALNARGWKLHSRPRARSPLIHDSHAAAGRALAVSPCAVA